MGAGGSGFEVGPRNLWDRGRASARVDACPPLCVDLRGTILDDISVMRAGGAVRRGERGMHPQTVTVTGLSAHCVKLCVMHVYLVCRCQTVIIMRKQHLYQICVRVQGCATQVLVSGSSVSVACHALNNVLPISVVAHNLSFRL